MKTIRAILLLLISISAAWPQTIPNPSFESNVFTVFPGYASGNGGVITGWTLSPATYIGLNPSGSSPFADNGVTPQGANIAFIQSLGGSNNTLSTTITGLTPGVTYQVSFRANCRTIFGTPNPTWSLNGSAFVAFTASPAVNANGVFSNPYYTNSGTFVASGTTAALALRNQTVTDTTVLLDNFSISAVTSLLVSNTNDFGAGSLRTVVSNAPAGGTITFAAGLSGKIILLTNGQITVNKNLTIDASALGGGAIISGNGNSRIFYVTNSATVTLNALTLTNGNVAAGSGGALYNFLNCVVTLTNCTLTGNTVNGGDTNYDNSGGAIYNAGRMTIGDCRLLGNTATGSPGIRGCDDCLTNITRPCPSNPTPGFHCANLGGGAVAGGGGAAGGAIQNVGTLTVMQSLLAGNSATGGNGGSGGDGAYEGGYGSFGGGGRGGAICNTGTMTNIQNTISNNIAIGGFGGGGGSAYLYQQGGGGFTGGTGTGGGIYNTGTNVLVQNTIAGNIASGSFGGYGGSASHPYASNGEQIGGSPGAGGTGISGGIFNAGTMLLTQNTLSGNAAIGGTGGFGGAGLGGTTTFARSSARGGLGGPSFGGGIFNTNGALLTLNQNTLTGNSAIGGRGGQGGMAASDNIIVTSAAAGGPGNDGTGGSIYNAGTLVLNQNTLSGNFAGGGLGGPGGVNFAGTTPTSSNTNGLAGTGVAGGIFNVGTLTLTNTIVAGNSAAFTNDIAGPFTAVTSLTNGSPALAALNFYGGSTQTMPPLLGSRAINAGAATSFTTDQRGLPRPVGAPDIGAVELQAGESYSNIIVLNSADSGYGSLRQAAQDAPANATIAFATNLSGQTIMVTNGQIVFTKNVTIDGSILASPIQLSGGHTNRIFLVTNATVTLNTLTLTNCYDNGPDGGGAVINYGNLTVTNCTFAGNYCGNAGGAINGYAGSLIADNSTFFNNSCGYAGGAVISYSPTAMNQCTIASNNATGFGGGIMVWSTGVSVNQCTVTGNSSPGGGGIYQFIGQLALTNSYVVGNVSPGGIVPDNLRNENPVLLGGVNLTNGAMTLAPLGNYGGPTLTMPPLPGSPAINSGGASSFITDQRGLTRPVGAPDIGAVELQAGEEYYYIVLNNGDADPGSLRQVVSNAPAGATIRFTNTLSGQTILLTNGVPLGGGFERLAEIALNKDLIIDGSTLANSIQINGANYSRVFSVGNGATVTLKSLVVVNGYDEIGSGSGILNSGTLNLNNVTVSGNYNYGSGGGGIKNTGSLTLTNSTVTSNRAYNGSGGGILNSGALTVNNSTLSGNIGNGISASGGGIFNSSTLTMQNSTLSGNSGGPPGGGIYNDSGGTTTMNNVTVASNSVGTSGGGIWNNGGVLKLTNSIVSANSAGLVSNNIYGSYSGVSNLVNTASINLAALGNYGGPTMTMPPLLGSPAIDAGSDSATNSYSTDQRGYVRKVGTHVDVGAVEGVLSSGGPAKLINVTRLGNGSLRFGFTNVSGTTYTVFAATNVALPVSVWSNLGPATETPASSGQFQFTDLQATNFARRFYRVGSP